jgi:hypothetical protein
MAQDFNMEQRNQPILSGLVHRALSSVLFRRAYFDGSQGARNEHSRSYVSDEQRRIPSKEAESTVRNLVPGALGSQVSSISPGTMLSSGIRKNYLAGVGRLGEPKGVHLIASGSQTEEENSVPAKVFTTDASTFFMNPSLAEEVFGPSTLSVSAKGKINLLKLEGMPLLARYILIRYLAAACLSGSARGRNLRTHRLLYPGTGLRRRPASYQRAAGRRADGWLRHRRKAYRAVILWPGETAKGRQ